MVHSLLQLYVCVCVICLVKLNFSHDHSYSLLSDNVAPPSGLKAKLLSGGKYKNFLFFFF